MGKIITLEDILNLYLPEEPISLSMGLNPGMKQEMYKGMIKDMPSYYLEKYKDKEVCSLYTPFAEDEEKRHLPPELQELQENCKEERCTYIALNNTAPKEGFTVFGDEFSKLKSGGDVCITDLKAGKVLYDGLAKEIPTELSQSLWDKSAVFSDYIYTGDCDGIYMIVVE